MNFIDLSYSIVVNLVGRCARYVINQLPLGWQLRLRAIGPTHNPGWIWVQAVSVGELILCEGLIKKLKLAGYKIHITTGTVAGFNFLKKNINIWSDGTNDVSFGIFPLDDNFGLSTFFVNNPGAFISIETEIWPNLLNKLDRHGICSCVVNGRLTSRSLSGIGRIWISRAVKKLSIVVARDEYSAQAFKQLGAPNVFLGGNLKADISLPKPLHNKWHYLRLAWKEYPIIVIGNTVDNEEEELLMVWKKVRLVYPTTRLIIAPRQPSRFTLVANLLIKLNIPFRYASLDWSCYYKDWEDIDILLLDTIGELAGVYKEGDLALIGGGWKGFGGHNPLESARFGIPTFIGPRYSNFKDLVEPLVDAKLVQIAEINNLSMLIINSFKKNYMMRHFLKNSVELPSSLTGTLDKTWQLIKDVLPTNKL